MNAGEFLDALERDMNCDDEPMTCPTCGEPCETTAELESYADEFGRDVEVRCPKCWPTEWAHNER